MKLEPQIYFAPFQGITTPTFRNVYSRHFTGVDKLFTPYFSKLEARFHWESKKFTALKNQFENGIEVIPQILSKDVEEILWFTQNCQQLGFKEVNWNLGCPYPMVANKKLGSGLLAYPKLVDEILHKVLPEISISFSIKCRLGYNSKNEFMDLIPVFNSYPISGLIVHARTGRQLYSGATDLEAFARVSAQINSPLVYNGDIFNLNDYQEFKTHFPNISRMMLGRGILKDPFLPARIKRLELSANPKSQVHQFINDLYYAYRKEKNDQLSLLNTLKEYWTYLSCAFDEPIKVLRILKKCKSFDAYEDAVNAIFSEHNLIV